MFWNEYILRRGFNQKSPNIWTLVKDTSKYWGRPRERGWSYYSGRGFVEQRKTGKVSMFAAIFHLLLCFFWPVVTTSSWGEKLWKVTKRREKQTLSEVTRSFFVPVLQTSMLWFIDNKNYPWHFAKHQLLLRLKWRPNIIILTSPRIETVKPTQFLIVGRGNSLVHREPICTDVSHLLHFVLT